MKSLNDLETKVKRILVSLVGISGCIASFNVERVETPEIYVPSPIPSGAEVTVNVSQSYLEKYGKIFFIQNPEGEGTGQMMDIFIYIPRFLDLKERINEIIEEKSYNSVKTWEELANRSGAEAWFVEGNEQRIVYPKEAEAFIEREDTK